MFASSSRKPYTAITVQIERMTSPEYEADDFSGIVDLIEVVRIQDTGPAEAARALRKKLKYGSTHRQLRALTILDGLMENAGTNFRRSFADEALLERLRILPRDEMVDKEVRDKCNVLFRQWAVDYKGQPHMTNIAQLYKQLPNKKRPTASQSKVVRETEQEAQRDNPFGAAADDEPTSPTHARRASNARPSPAPTEPSSSRPRAQSSGSIFGSSKKDKDKNKDKKKTKASRNFDLEKERPQIMQAIANANLASTNLTNALKHVNRETHRVSEDRQCLDGFEKCKSLRRTILRYIQFVEHDQLIGSLLSANDELVQSLMSFEIFDKSIDDDSDSDVEATAPSSGGTRSRSSSNVDQQMASLSVHEQAPVKPPRPTAAAPPLAASSGYARTPLAGGAAPSRLSTAAEEDPDDPFGDNNAI